MNHEITLQCTLYTALRLQVPFCTSCCATASEASYHNSNCNATAAAAATVYGCCYCYCALFTQGKTRIVEAANEVIGRGYSAIYYLNSTGQYNLASSVLRLHNGTFEPDVELPRTDWLDKLRFDEGWYNDGSASASADMKLRSARYIMSANVSTLA